MPDVLNTVVGQDAIKGGIFYGSNLTPNGSFSNTPQKTEVTVDTYMPKPTIQLTLEKIKDSFNKAVKTVNKSDDVLSESTIQAYLSTYTQLLIDYEDLRNLICFGSSYNELVYNIDYLIDNFPYRAYIARTSDQLNFRLLPLNGNKTKIVTRVEDVVFAGKLQFNNSGKTIWPEYDFVDKNNIRYPIVSFSNSIFQPTLDVKIKAVNFYQIETNRLEVAPGDVITFIDNKSSKIGVGKVQEYIPKFDTLETYGLVQKTYKCFNSVQTSLDNTVIKHNLNSNNLKVSYFNNNNNKIINVLSESNFTKNDSNTITINLNLSNNLGITVLITSLLEQDGNIIIDSTKNWEENSLVGEYVEINSKQYSIISNTKTSITLDIANTFKKNDFFIVETYSPIEFVQSEENVSFYVRFDPVIFVNSYATVGGLINLDLYKLVDSTKNWVENEWEGKYLTVIAGKGAGKSLKILSNTKTELILEGDFNIALDKTSQYLISSYPNLECQLLFPSSIMEFVVEGALSLNGLLNYTITDTLVEKGYIIAPKLTKVINFTATLSGIQKALLNPLNPTPWPRERFTENIITFGPDFENWIQNPYNMTKYWEEDEDYYKDENTKYNLIGAITLDETKTNQLIRRCIPSELINELNETEKKMFSRYVLLAGKMFDTIKVYIDFIRYAHTLNYTKINQLSPQFYKQYAEHYGFALFDEDQIELAKTIIYGDQLTTQSLTPTFPDSQNITTVKDIINEKQKLLLINLFNIYQTKGTADCLKYLTTLLGAPEGLIIIEEFAYNQTKNEKIVDNNKVNVPSIKMVIDESFLKNKNDIQSSENFPYVFKYELDNENIINLRELSVGLNPLQAILKDILSFGEIKHCQGSFFERSYGSLQKSDSYFALPLSFPNKYSGMLIDYSIPKGGFKKGIVTNQGDCSFNLCGLCKLEKMKYETSIFEFYDFQTDYPPSIMGEDENNIQYSLTFSLPLLEGFNEGNIYICFPSLNINGQYQVIDTTIIENKTVITISIVVNKTIDIYQLINSEDSYVQTDYFNVLYSKIVPLKKNYNYKIPPTYSYNTDNLTNSYKDNVLFYPSTSDKINDSSLLSLFSLFNEGDVINVYYNHITLGGTKNDFIGKFIIKNNFEETKINLIESINTNNTFNDFSVVEDDGIIFVSNYTVLAKEPDTISFGKSISDSVIVTSFSNFQNNITYNSNFLEEYIFTKIEDKDLTLRIKFRNEAEDNSLPSTIERVAILKNVFNDDGLKHSLKLLFTPKGGEVYLDNNFIGLAIWKKVDLNNSQGWNARNYPKIEIESLTSEPIPYNLFAFPGLIKKEKDYFNWWDLFTGYPVNMDLSLMKISILENLYITQPDLIDPNINPNNYITEKWVFDFINQEKDKDNNYLTTKINISSEYQLGNPIPITDDVNIYVAIENYILTNIDKVNLTSKVLPHGKVNFEESLLDFFKNISPLTMEEIFLNNAYDPFIHTNYEYINLNSLIENYYNFAEVTLTYKNLLPFIETVELKFRKITEQFLPIVLNLTSFGKIIESYYAKTYYTKAFFQEKATRNSILEDFDLPQQNGEDGLIVTYVEKTNPLNNKNPYIYYKKEEKENIFIYKKSEPKSDMIIYKQSEN